MASRLFHESSLLLFFLLFSLVSMNFDLIIRVWLILIRGCGFQWATDNIPIKNILDPPLHVAGWPNAGLIIWCAALLVMYTSTYYYYANGRLLLDHNVTTHF